jgi:hypothetical protein
LNGYSPAAAEAMYLAGDIPNPELNQSPDLPAPDSTEGSSASATRVTASSPTSAVVETISVLVTPNDYVDHWASFSHIGQPPVVVGHGPSFNTIWNVVRVGGFLGACADGAEVGGSVGGPVGAAFGCLAVGLAFDIGAEQARQRIQNTG